MFVYSRKRDGMTLLEIMLALVVLSVVMFMVSMSLSGTFEVVDSVSERGEIYYRAQVALTRISEDLTSAVLNENVPFVGERGEVNGARADNLRFASMAHLVFGSEEELSGPATISYAVKADEESGELILYRDDTLLMPTETEESQSDTGEPAGFVLCNRLKSVRFSFVDADGGEVDSWLASDGEEEATPLPVAVTCTLEFPAGNNGEDADDDTSLSFSVSVPIPAGLIRASGE